MKPDLATIQRIARGVDQAVVEQHLQRLENDYFEQFTTEQIAEHVASIAELTAEQPVITLASQHDDGDVECTVVAQDRAGAFALITGLLASTGYQINSGDVFTYAKPAPTPGSGRRPSRRSGKTAVIDPARRRYLIDHFRGDLREGMTFERWRRRFDHRLSETLEVLGQGSDGVRRARQRVNQWVIESLARTEAAQPPVLYPVKVTLSEEGGRNRMEITGQDTPAFLYTLAASLSLQKLLIENVAIRSHGDRVEDVVHFVDARGEPIRDQQTLDRVQFVVLLTKQFSYFLTTAPDPYRALSRFEQMVDDIARQPDRTQWRDMLSNPRTMSDLARVLGASTYLWEDFIRTQYETLLPICTPHINDRHIAADPDSLGERMEAALDGAVGLAEQKDRINKFKDSEVFQIDLEYLLNDDMDFRNFGARLTQLAEHLVRLSTQCVYDDLVRSYGEPQKDNGETAQYAIFGLGKLGGRALGYASDIELLYVYDETGETAGGKRGRVTNTEFFCQMVKDVAQFIRAKREGIFAVDLRLRPHGKDGPMASSAEQFAAYYKPGGSAHAVERLALVRMRHIGGDNDFGNAIEDLRDEYLYRTKGAIDPDDIWNLRRKQYEQKVERTQHNAKYSVGALVDLEYTVQLLQVLFYDTEPRLHSPSVYNSLELLRDMQVLGQAEADGLVDAYRFLRRLINGLRMLRGNARDLGLPPGDSDELMHLARRLGYKRIGWMGPSRQLLVDFDLHTAAVRLFVEKQFGRESLADLGYVNVADVIISDALTDDVADRAMAKAGFDNPATARQTLRDMRDIANSRFNLAKAATYGVNVLQYEPTRDRALQRWRQLLEKLDQPRKHLQYMRHHPRELELMLSIFAGDDALADALLDDPRKLNVLADARWQDDRRRIEDLHDTMLGKLSA